MYEPIVDGVILRDKSRILQTRDELFGIPLEPTEVRNDVGVPRTNYRIQRVIGAHEVPESDQNRKGVLFG